MQTKPTTPAPNCWKCKHHVITHKPDFPYACLAMQFKSRRLPCKDVLEASGQHCLLFEKKTT